MDGHRVFETQDGTRSLYSERFGVSYHSKYGAWQETQHVFIDAGLRYRAVDEVRISVLDIGYGTGLNAIAALLFAEQRQLELHYTGVDAFPVPTKTLDALNYPQALGWNAAESELYNKLQHLNWGPTLQLSPKLSITKLHQHFEGLRFRESYDVIFYDAFAPEAQPELWTPARFAAMYQALRPGGVLVTYCAKGQVKRDLRSVGFDVERLKGPPGKREMTRASKPN